MQRAQSVTDRLHQAPPNLYLHRATLHHPQTLPPQSSSSPTPSPSRSSSVHLVLMQVTSAVPAVPPRPGQLDSGARCDDVARAKNKFAVAAGPRGRTTPALYADGKQWASSSGGLRPITVRLKFGQSYKLTWPSTAASFDLHLPPTPPPLLSPSTFPLSCLLHSPPPLPPTPLLHTTFLRPTPRAVVTRFQLYLSFVHGKVWTRFGLGVGGESTGGMGRGGGSRGVCVGGGGVYETCSLILEKERLGFVVVVAV